MVMYSANICLGTTSLKYKVWKVFLTLVIYNILFLLRNSNDIMINFIKNCPSNSYEKLSELLVNFFYENTIESSFNEEELMVIIYLIIEDLIINKMPKSFSATSNQPDTYLNNSILYHIFKYITRKADVRDFTCTILSEILLKLEGFNQDLSKNMILLELGGYQNSKDELSNTIDVIVEMIKEFIYDWGKTIS